MTDLTTPRYESVTMAKFFVDGDYYTVKMNAYAHTQTQAVAKLREHIRNKGGHIGRFIDLYDRIENEHLRYNGNSSYSVFTAKDRQKCQTKKDA